VAGQIENSILIVDDDFEFRRSLMKTLEKEGYDVTTAESGLQASAMLLKRHFSLIVLDIFMPGKSGFEVMEEVKVRSPESKVIMITAHGDRDIYRKTEDAGAFAFLNKPIKRDQILKYTHLALKDLFN
jgi:two-component system NtrC family response regulator